MISKYALVFLPLAAVALLGAGCAPATPGVEVTQRGEVATYTDPSTGATVNVGAGATVPSDFPKDVPVYGNGVIQTASAAMNSGTPGATLLLTTTDSAETVGDWYTSELTSKGWVKTGTYNYGTQSTTIYTKATITISLTVSAGEEAGQNSVFVIWTDEVGANIGP